MANLKGSIENFLEYVDGNPGRWSGDDSYFNELVEELADNWAAAQPDETIGSTEAEQVVHFNMPESGPAAIRVFRNGGQEEVFELVIHTSSDYPSVDVIRKARGDLYARVMVNGAFVIDEHVPGNHSVIVVLAQD